MWSLLALSIVLAARESHAMPVNENCSGSSSHYIDSLTGDDWNSGASAEQPWRSIKMIDDHVMRAGDTIYLRRGSWFSGPVIVRGHATTDCPISLLAYDAGARPIIYRSGKQVGADGLIIVRESDHVRVESMEIRGSAAHGIAVYRAEDVVISDCIIHDSSRNGVVIFDSSEVRVRGNTVYNNNRSGVEEFSGVLIGGSPGRRFDGFLVEGNRIYGNTGTPRHNGNGVKLGSTEWPPIELRKVKIIGNEIYLNGNFLQNQFGRGITSAVAGEILIAGNYIHDNASAGAYVGDVGLTFTVRYEGNKFVNNHLRAFGWVDDGVAVASANTIICDEAGVPCVGLEYGGRGSFHISDNVFLLRPHPIYGAVVEVHTDSSPGAISRNVYWDSVAGVKSMKYLIGDFRDPLAYHTFDEWVRLTGDADSAQLDPASR
jgi:parallel beta-helix repeat protein